MQMPESMSLPKRTRSTHSIAAFIMIGAILIITAMFLSSCGADQTDTPLDSTSTTIASVPSVSATTGVTSLPTVLTDTPVPAPSPAASESSTRFEETFTDNQNNWYTKEALVTVMNGKYVHVLNCPDSSPSSQCGNFVNIPFTFPTNFRLQIEATLTKSSDGNGVMFGIQVRKSDEGYYYINYLITRGSYEMTRITQTGEFIILPETQTDLMKSAVGDTNVLGIEVNGAEFTPLVNDQELPPIHDGNIRTAGESYLVVLVERGHSAELQLDNLIVERTK